MSLVAEKGKKNRGFVYDGYVLPLMRIKQLKSGGAYIYKDSMYEKTFKELNVYAVINWIDERGLNKGPADDAAYESFLRTDWIPNHMNVKNKDGDELEFGEFFLTDGAKLKNSAEQYADAVIMENKRDRDEMTEIGAVGWSKQNEFTGNQNFKRFQDYHGKAFNQGKADKALAGAKAETKSAQAEATAAKTVATKAKKKARAALRGARAAGAATTTGTITAEEAQQLQADLESIKKVLGSGAYRNLSDGIMKKYLDGAGNLKPNLKSTDAAKLRQLVDTENQKLARQVSSSFSSDDNEYSSPDSAAASAAVPPTSVNIVGTGAGSAAPLKTPLPPSPTNVPPGLFGGGVPARPVPSLAGPAGPVIPQPPPPPPVPIGAANMRVRLNPAQQAVDDAEAEALRQAGLRNVSQPPPPPSNAVLAEGEQQEGMTQEDRSENISLQVQEQEKSDSGTKTDDNLDVSKYGYDKQVSMFAIQEDRDFTYSKTLVKASNQNIKEGLMEALKMWGYTIEIMKPKTSDEEEALEIRTFIFLAKEKYSLDRQWKKALTQLPDALDDIGFSGSQTATATTGTGQQMGLITQFANPQVFANFLNQAQPLVAGQGGQGAPPVAGQPPPPPPPGPPIIGGSQSSRGRQRPTSVGVPGGRARASSIGSATSLTSATSQGGFASAESSSDDDEFRRRLTGLGRDVGYTRRPTGQTLRAGERTERIPAGGQGVQRVRVARASAPRPQRKATRLDTRPRMNVKKTQFKMRKSRINPNLLFTNLLKQNPNPVGQDSIFKTRTTAKTIRRISL